jgi:Sec-independent protein translocase protein TatA
VKYILLAILFYLGFQFIVRFVIPVYRATTKIKSDFSKMESRMQEQMNQQQNQSKQHPNQAKSTKIPKEDYIDFEEIK